MTRMTPGTYLRKRREAAGLSQLDVARRTRLDQSELSKMERGARPISPIWATLLSVHIGFPDDVLIALIRGDTPAPRVCSECACSEYDPCFDDLFDDPCHWVSATLCSSCAVKQEPAA